MSSISNQSNGVVAQWWLGLKLPVGVMQSASGYYLGTSSDGMPISRESVEYYCTHDEALRALESGNWTQRHHP